MSLVVMEIVFFLLLSWSQQYESG